MGHNTEVLEGGGFRVDRGKAAKKGGKQGLAGGARFGWAWMGCTGSLVVPVGFYPYSFPLARVWGQGGWRSKGVKTFTQEGYNGLLEGENHAASSRSAQVKRQFAIEGMRDTDLPN